MSHMLDTVTASHVIRRRSPPLEARLAAILPSDLCVSAITRAELLYGLERLPPNHRLHVGVRQFLRIVPVLACDQAAADQYADIRHQLVSSFQAIGEMDMIIAVHALALNAVLVTNNVRHFTRVAGPLMLVNWAED